MKKFISVLFSVLFCLTSFPVISYATEEIISAENFFSQVKDLANTYDDNDGLASGDSEVSYTNRLIVKTKTNDPLDDYFDASAVVEGYDGLHFLQYLNKVQAENAYIGFSFEDVEYVEYDFYFDASETENAADYELLEDGHLSWNSAATQVDKAINYISESGIECSEVRVAVIDSGVYAAHRFFDNSNKKRIVDSNYIYKVWYRSKEDGSKYSIDYSSMEDDYYHGTHVSGIIFDNTMDNVKIVPYRVTNERNILYSDVLSAFESILITNSIVIPEDETLINNNPDDDIDIVNMSFCGYLADLDSDGKTLYEKMSLAVQNGMIIVAAAGNNSSNADVFFPACHPGVITVSATDENNEPADLSNSGTSVDVAAPGVNINSTTPRKFTDDNDDTVCPAYSTSMEVSGTSMSTPLVAAAAATLKSINPDITPAEVERIIKETAYVPEVWNTNYGTGIVDFYDMVRAEVSKQPKIIRNSKGEYEIISPVNSNVKIYYTVSSKNNIFETPTVDNHLLYTEPLSTYDLMQQNNGEAVKKIVAVCHESGKLISEPVEFEVYNKKEITINYKETLQIMPEYKAAGSKWMPQNPDIVSVDKAGNITGESIGETVVTVVTSSGEKIYYNITVEYAWWQQIIRILLLGFLWY